MKNFFGKFGNFQSIDVPYALQEERRQFNCLVVEDYILHRLFHFVFGEINFNQFCVSKTLWREIVFRLHICKNCWIFGGAKTVEEFRKQFSCNFQEIPICNGQKLPNVRRNSNKAT